MLCLVCRIYHRTQKVPPYILFFLCCTSYRIHSIFILRLFNDPVAVCLLFVALNLMISKRWKMASLFYSLAVSVKMNILLFAPALLLLLLGIKGFTKTLLNLSICAAVQVVLALPFLLVNPVGYVTRAFDLGRVFLFQWTVNWRFLPEEVFVNRTFHLVLLGLHVTALVVFFLTRWRTYLTVSREQQVKKVIYSANYIVLPMFTANFLGLVFSRSLHYQFYIWYFHSLPYLLWCTQLSVITRLCILGVLELCWNTYPSTALSSGALHVCHLVLLYALWRDAPVPKFIRGPKKQT
jgi:alpha-1,3-mannosyltransferase